MDLYDIASFADGYYIVYKNTMIVQTGLVKDVLDGRARLYAVLRNTNSTNEFIFYHDSGTTFSLPIVDLISETLRMIHDVPPIPLSLIRQTTDVTLSELTLVNQTQYSQLDRIEMLAQVALEQIHTIRSESIHQTKVQKRIADLVIQDAIKQELSCPITINPFTLETAACVAPCYHVFDKDAITRWLETKNTCPECREQCNL
jgi:hypothetical protein